MAVKPAECHGISLALRQKIDEVEARADEALRTQYDPKTDGTRQSGGAEKVKVPTNHVFSEQDKELFRERYGEDWRITFEGCGMTHQTLAIFSAKEFKNGKK